MADSRWHQDLEVAQLIEHLNQEDKFERLDNLTPSEVRVILRELDHCRRDFIYAARNYFYITTKTLQNKLFSLWPAQELILEKVLELKAKGLPQKIIVIKARQLGCCLSPDTKVLTANFRWVRIDDLGPGDEIVGVDEHSPGGVSREQRRTRRAIVEAKRDVFQPAYKLTMDNGKALIATGEHRFLCRRRGGTEAVWMSPARQGSRKQMSPIVVGDHMRLMVNEWADPGWDDAWFGGLMDGEGSLRHRADCGGFEGSVSQVLTNGVYDRAKEYLVKRGYTFSEDLDTRTPENGSKFGKNPVGKLRINSFPQLMRLIGQTRPTRFIGKTWWENNYLPKTTESWVEVVKIELLPTQRMVDLQTSTKTFIANGFVSHNSTLIEALIAWRTMFFSNINALVVSYDKAHTSDVLFPIMCFIYDNIPWWLKPMCAQRKADELLYFDNPKPELRSINPGLNSKVFVRGANSAGVGQGIRLSAVHCSEFTQYADQVARGILDEDMVNALVEDANTFAILESTAKGANRYGHKLWKRCMELMGTDEAEWYPLFLPWFFEETRVRPITVNWRVETPEFRMREKVESEWLRCQSPECAQYHYRYVRKVDRVDSTCPTCGVGILKPYILTEEQLSWYQNRRKNADRDEDSSKKLKQEMATTAEESFQLTGYQIFGQKAQDFANISVRNPIAEGDFDLAGRFHGCNTTNPKNEDGYYSCYQEDCNLDHTYDDAPLKIWEWPKPEAEYCIGADLSEGLGGKSAYSVGVAIRFSTTGGGDYQVATWRANTIDPIGFAYKLNHLGLLYNSGLMSVECNRYDICLGTLRYQLGYPNLYRWKHLDSLNIMSNKLGWWTNMSSRPRLWQTFKRWLQQELFFVRSRNLAEEMKNFVKDEEDSYSAGGDQDEWDDELLACMISLYTAHEGDWNDALGMIAPKAKLAKEDAVYVIKCQNCPNEWWANTVEDKNIDPTEFQPQMDPNHKVVQSGGMRCAVCGSRRLEITRNNNGGAPVSQQGEDDLINEANQYWDPSQEWNNPNDMEVF